MRGKVQCTTVLRPEHGVVVPQHLVLVVGVELGRVELPLGLVDDRGLLGFLLDDVLFGLGVRWDLLEAEAGDQLVSELHLGLARFAPDSDEESPRCLKTYFWFFRKSVWQNSFSCLLRRIFRKLYMLSCRTKLERFECLKYFGRIEEHKISLFVITKEFPL